jgi:hypothetical protein
MRAALVILLALSLAACGKKEAPSAAGADPGTSPTDCIDVAVVDVEKVGDEWRTLFDAQVNGKTTRVARFGKWGSTGDRFSYCNYYSQPK